MKQIRIGQSRATDPRQAVAELHAAIAQPDSALVLFFCSSHYPRDALAAALNQRFGATPLIGCTAAGEIGPAGYLQHSLTGVSFPATDYRVVSGRLDTLQQFSIAAGREFSQGLRQQLQQQVADASAANSFGLLLIDGLSVREEPVARTLQTGLGDLTLFGGSAGDDLKFESTWLFHDGAFHADCALLTLIATRQPFKLFKTQHFVSLDERLVVTEADPERRLVRELNGLPAADEYARLVGVERAELDPTHFAATPVVVVIGGTDYVRSIQRVEADGSLVFYCAIEEGLVLRVARGVDLEANLEHTLAGLAEQLGPPQLLLACDCILRNLEISQRGSKAQVESLFQRYRGVGFSTYGEQYGGVHINQTLTGVMIGGGENG